MTIRFAIIGAGNISQVHARAIASLPDTAISVICGRSGARGPALARDYGADWTTDVQAAVSRGDVDIVAICTPSGSHAEIAEAAAAAGKHLLVEKPLDVTLPRVDRIIAAADQAGIKLAGVLPSRFRRGVVATKQALAAGRLGRQTLATASIAWYRSQEYYDRGGWRGTWALDGGGALMNQSIHTIDLLQWLRDGVTEISGQTATLAHRMETEDTATALLRFTDGGLGLIHAGTGCYPGDPARIELHGDRGTIVLEEGRIVTWQLADTPADEAAAMLAQEPRTGSGASDPMGISIDGHRAQIADLIAAIHDNRDPAVTGRDARKSVELIRAIYHSASEHHPVTLPMTEDEPDGPHPAPAAPPSPNAGRG